MEVLPVSYVHPCHSYPEIRLSQVTNKEKGGCRKLDHKKSKKEKKEKKNHHGEPSHLQMARNDPDTLSCT